MCIGYMVSTRSFQWKIAHQWLIILSCLATEKLIFNGQNHPMLKIILAVFLNSFRSSIQENHLYIVCKIWIFIRYPNKIPKRDFGDFNASSLPVLNLNGYFG